MGCYCESCECEHHRGTLEDAPPCQNVTDERDNTRELGNVCQPCRENYAAAGYALTLSQHALQARDHWAS